jgi:5-methylcytosine-specific restriction endonuclease McrA
MPRQYSRACAQCGATFSITHPKSARKFCSRACQGRARQTLVSLVCPVCGASFQRKPSQVAKYSAAFCSRTCWGISVRKEGSAPITRRCVTCDALFQASTLDIARGDGKYCSRACASVGFRRGQQVACLACGKPVYSRPSQPRKYCSHACYARNITLIKLTARQGATYRAWRGAVFARDGYTCQDCGQRGGDLTAHHAKPYAQYPLLRFDVGNGVTLCRPCHWARHAGVPRVRSA